MPSIVAQNDSDQSPAASNSTLSQLKDPDFDSITFLNETLPTLTLSSQTASVKSSRSSQLQTVSSEVPSLASQLNTHNIRASSELTSLTDEILRSGNRLAYEVEILRGDINNLYELLSDTLKDDIRLFVQNEAIVDGRPIESVDGMENHKSQATIDPAFMTQLRLLSLVKARLESVVGVFGEAMKWPIPPSELSTASSLISVSAPELGIQTTAEDDKAHEIARNYRTEVTELMNADGGGYASLEAATKRVEEFRQLASIWKGTAEEKPRNRFVDSLAKIVEDRRKMLDAKNASQRSKDDYGSRSGLSIGRPGRPETPSGGGLFRGLARLKDDLYLE